jgi:tetratricopeptide (TPR) repeat protein
LSRTLPDRVRTATPGDAGGVRQPRDALEEFNVRVSELYRAGEYESALSSARQALVPAESRFGPDSRDVAAVLNSMGLLYKLLGRLSDAEQAYGRALAILKSLSADETVVAVVILDNLGNLYRERGR